MHVRAVVPMAAAAAKQIFAIAKLASTTVVLLDRNRAKPDAAWARQSQHL